MHPAHVKYLSVSVSCGAGGNAAYWGRGGCSGGRSSRLKHAGDHGTALVQAGLQQHHFRAQRADGPAHHSMMFSETLSKKTSAPSKACRTARIAS